MLSAMHRGLELFASHVGANWNDARGDYLTGVHTFVNEVHRDTGLCNASIERLPDCIHPREPWKERGVDVDDASAEPLDEAPIEELHVASADHEFDPLALEPVSHRQVSLDSVGEIAGRKRPRVDPRGVGSRKSGRIRLVGGDSDEFDHPLVSRPFDQRLEVGSLTRGENGDR